MYKQSDRRLIFNTVNVFSEENNASLSDTMKIGAFASMNPKPVKDIPDIMPIAPFSRLLFERIPSPVPCTECKTSKSDVVNEQDKNGNSDSPSQNGDGECPNPGITMVSTNDDFIMVDLVNICRITCLIQFALLTPNDLADFRMTPNRTIVLRFAYQLLHVYSNNFFPHISFIFSFE